jgi:NAD(P)-dependent dehydrogenase (short-subunit alcohol dehydrogenase family)
VSFFYQVSITTSMVDHPIAGVTASVPMITKGGIESISKNLTMEYAKEGIRFTTVAPGIVDTPLQKCTLPERFARLP